MSKITKAHDIKVEEYLRYPELRIPVFQRGYVWEDEQIDEFWEDLTVEGIQFLGSIILKDEHYNDDAGTGYLEIVDGQQRTVSLLILLSAISRHLAKLAGTRKKAFEQNAEKQAEEIDMLISERDRRDLTKVLSFKLKLPSEADSVAFQAVLNGTAERKKGVQDGFLDAQEKLDGLIDAHLDRLGSAEEKVQALIDLKLLILDMKIIEVLVPTDEDAYMIFETVNARGADLGAAELLKNHLFARIGGSSGVHEEWERVRKTLADADRRGLDLTGFLRYYWIAKYEHLSKKGLYRGIKKRMGTKKSEERVEPETVLREISAFRMTLEKIFVEGLDDWRASFGDDRQNQRRAHEWFSYRQNLLYFPKSIQYLPVYTAIMGNLDKVAVNERPFIGLLLAVEKINFLYSAVQQLPTNRIDKLLSGIGREVLAAIEGGDSSKITAAVQSGTAKIEKFLRENLDRSAVDKYVAALSWSRRPDKAMIYFILTNLEYEKGGYSRLMVREDLSLEHIYPKSIEKNKAIEGWEVPDFDFTKLGHGLGNLTFLAVAGPQANGSAGERSFMDKKEHYLLPSVYAINRYFENLESWDGAAIEARLRAIQDFVWERWGAKE